MRMRLRALCTHHRWQRILEVTFPQRSLQLIIKKKIEEKMSVS